MIEHNGGTFSRTRVDLDDNRYTDCTFNECEIVYSAKSPIHLDGCRFNKCSYRFEGAAGATLKMMAALYKLSPELMEQTFDNIRGAHGLPPDDGTKWVKAG